jgi:hypothetical protein
MNDTHNVIHEVAEARTVGNNLHIGLGDLFKPK